MPRLTRARRPKFDPDQAKRLFPKACVGAGLPEPACEVRFHPTRKWRLDYGFLAHRVGVECEGGVWTGGRHTRGSGYVKDLEKYSEAAALGWRLIRVTPDQLCTDRTFDWIRRALAA